MAIYFSLPFEPVLAYSCAAFMVALIAAIVVRKRQNLFPFFIIATLIAAGFAAAAYRTTYIKAPILQDETGVTKVIGIIDEIHSLPHGKRVILSSPQIEGIEYGYTPAKIRVNINTSTNGAGIGDKISILAALSPPPQPVIPGGYDFARHVFFDKVGAVGYAVSKAEIIEKSQNISFLKKVEHLRQIIIDKILAALPEQQANIATALLVGEKGGIEKRVIEDIRVAGIAHLLAISGMHLSLVAAFFFFLSRAIMAAIPPLALKYNIKKWAAIIAIMGSFFYLLISGAPISAQRAFLMTSLILIAITIDRSGMPMRSVALAAMIIMVISPESILTPSFQMSFAAVIALISGYETLQPKFREYSDYGIVKRSMIYFLGLIISSWIAGIATAPFAVYHFNNFASYGILANLIAIPVTSFLVMPAGVFALLFMPLGLEALPLYLMGQGIDIITNTASYIASLPQATEIIPQYSNVSFALFIFGGLWLCLWQRKWRLLGLIPISVAFVSMFFVAKPDFIISDSGKLFAARDGSGKFIFSSNRAERYAKERWIERFAINDFSYLGKEKSENINCDALGCAYLHNNHKISIAHHPIAVLQDCADSDIVINLTYQRNKCQSGAIYMNGYNLEKKGAHVFYLGDKIEIENLADYRGNRPWVR